MKTLTLKLPEILEAQLNVLAHRRGVSRSEIVREAISEYVSRGDENPPGKFLDLTQDLAGSIDGPSDLSANKSHLKGYGQ